MICLEDIIGIVSCYIYKNRISDLLAYLDHLRLNFNNLFKSLSFLEYLPIKKNKIG